MGDFRATYSSAMVRFGDKEMTLEQAFRFKDMLCPATPEQEGNDVNQIAFLAGKLATGTLLPEHQYLIEGAR